MKQVTRAFHYFNKYTFHHKLTDSSIDNNTPTVSQILFYY